MQSLLLSPENLVNTPLFATTVQAKNHPPPPLNTGRIINCLSVLILQRPSAEVGKHPFPEYLQLKSDPQLT